MIVTRGLGRAAVLGAIVAFGLGVDQTAESSFSGGLARIGATPLLDALERAGPGLLDIDVRLGDNEFSPAAVRAGAVVLDEDGRAGWAVIASADERVGATSLTAKHRIGSGRLKKH